MKRVGRHAGGTNARAGKKRAQVQRVSTIDGSVVVDGMLSLSLYLCVDEVSVQLGQSNDRHVSATPTRATTAIALIIALFSRPRRLSARGMAREGFSRSRYGSRTRALRRLTW